MRLIARYSSGLNFMLCTRTFKGFLAQLQHAKFSLQTPGTFHGKRKRKPAHSLPFRLPHPSLAVRIFSLAKTLAVT
ncbi:hypothetical protein BD01_1669 [Thermococcus nautili]|uniref:Uncharacterized protein n=1 Tax=Thermococcus nautili TaxID=195522 RepID=W8NVT4_9EURY|nr:hypothetical protein BD01_1669 [Thermococcus nautili]